MEYGGLVMPQVTISLKPSEIDALIMLADMERRKLQHQAALIVVSELQRRGLLETISSSGESKDDDPKGATNVQPSR
jgi:hypothetical protein